ncbi:hypothetical protein DNTS_024112, partial [Danionella cerebrum]
MTGQEHLNLDSGLMKSLFAPGNAFVVAFIFLVFQYSFKLEFQCPCNAFDSKTFSLLYAFLPALGLFSLLTLGTKTCTFMYTQSGFSKMCAISFLKHFFRNMILSSMWIVTVFIDGDAWVCLQLTRENITNWFDQIPCKDNSSLTTWESTAIRRQQAFSQVIGLSVLFGLPGVYLLVALIIRFCCNGPFQSLLQGLYEEETIKCIEKEMRKRIHNHTKKECKNEFIKTEWEKFLNGLSNKKNGNSATSGTSHDTTGASSSQPGTSAKSLVQPGRLEGSQTHSDTTGACSRQPSTSAESLEQPGKFKAFLKMCLSCSLYIYIY